MPILISVPFLTPIAVWVTPFAFEGVTYSQHTNHHNYIDN